MIVLVLLLLLGCAIAYRIVQPDDWDGETN